MASSSCSAGATAAYLTMVLLLITSLHQLLGDGDQMVASAQQQRPSSILPLGSSWPASSLSKLTSPAGTFCFGWLQFPNASQNFYVAVWYADLDHTIVWVANHNAPAAYNDALQLTTDGNLLISHSKSPIWQTSTSSMGVSALQILDSGNVVLNKTASSYAWQSFSSPTDTLLPSQTFLSNYILRPAAFSTSLAASGKFKFYINEKKSSGIASIAQQKIIVWDATGRGLVFKVDAINNSNVSTAVAGQFNMTTGVFSMYNISTGVAYSQFVPSDFNAIKTLRRLTLDPDGNLRMYGWDYTSGVWAVLFEANKKFCLTMAEAEGNVCGPYGVCMDVPPHPACTCPPGFHPLNLGDVSLGCRWDNNLPDLPSCKSGQSSSYMVLHNTNFQHNNAHEAWNGKTLKECQSLCDQNCSCVAIVYDISGGAVCRLKGSLVNGYSPNQEPGGRDTYIKLSANGLTAISPPLLQSPATGLAWINSSANFWSQAAPNLSASLPAAPSSSRGLAFSIFVIAVLAISAGELLCVLLALFFLQKTGFCRLVFRSHPAKEASPSAMQHPGCQAFSYAEIVQATDNFTQPLGSGGFGEVVKGILPDGREIAVKRLQASTMQVAGTHDQFKAEIATLGRIHQFNLVRLYGYCAEDLHRLLVYEFMENGSMDSFLFEENYYGDGSSGGGPGAAGAAGAAVVEAQSDSERMIWPRRITRERGGPAVLSWRTRYDICLGTARGLAYLHEDCLDCIVHCDIKPENILLDRGFCPKVGDFGLAYLFGRNETLETTTIRGTRGYLAPEWLAFLPITAKADVFSYGMVLIEIVSGRRNFRVMSGSNTSAQSAVIMTPSWAFRQVQSGRLEEVVDPRVCGDVSHAEAEKVLRIAFLCLHQEARARPTMRSIVQMLEGSIELPQLPQGPGTFHNQVATGVDTYAVLQPGPLFHATSTPTTTITSASTSTLSPR